MRAIVMFAVVLLSRGVSSTALAQDAASEPPAVPVGGNIPFPRQVKDVRPVYPPAAQQARVQGMVIVGAASPAQYGGGVLWLYSQRASDGLMSYWEITPARGEALAPWNPRNGPPPLSIVDAIKAGETWLAQKSPDVKTFELASAALQRTQPYSGLGDRWFYRLEYDPVVAGRRLPGGSNFIVVVLLDGTVVEPRVDRPK